MSFYPTGDELKDEVNLDDCLLLLERLRYNYNPLLDRLLGLRGIRHLECRPIDEPLHAVLSTPTFNRSLSFLLIRKCNRPTEMEELMHDLGTNSSPYRNLRHLGILNFDHLPVSANSH